MPILMIYGTEDELYGCQEQSASRLTGSKKVTRVEIEGARHITHVDYPEQYYGRMFALVLSGLS